MRVLWVISWTALNPLATGVVGGFGGSDVFAEFVGSEDEALVAGGFKEDEVVGWGSHGVGG